MKVEVDLKGKQIAKLLALVVIGVVIGYTLALNTGGGGPGLFSSTGYLTTADLNREDIGASITLSRFCEGMGLISSVYWQQDAQGNGYGTPICLQPEQQ